MVYYGLPRITEIKDLGVNLGAIRMRDIPA
jgi:hypothetical protein